MKIKIRNAANELRPILNRIQSNTNKPMITILNGRDEVYARYQPIFSPENIHELTEDQFKSFLLFKNNRHWWSLHRFGGYMTADMNKLREALAILLDEGRTIQERFDLLLPNSGAFVPRLGGATLTPILHIAYPDKYGILNSATTFGLKNLNLYPDFDRKAPFSARYSQINEILLALASELQTDLWILDATWWQISSPQNPVDRIGSEEEIVVEDVEVFENQSFGLERYLQEFIRDNWEKIKELKDWLLYVKDGDLVGFEYQTDDAGRIDLLAYHRTAPKWLVIELKRNQTSDQTIGQVLRYMGWVKAKLAEPNEQVEGMIICKSIDTGLNYALTNIQNVRILYYEVNFQLHLQK